MMRYGLMLLAALWFPGLAHANQLRLVSYDMDDTGGIVRLASDVDIGEPWLRVEGRSLRIWFPQIKEIARFDHERDSSDPIHALFLRPGTSDTAVLRIEIGGSRKIKPSDVEIVRQGAQASVRIRVPQLQPVAPPVEPVQSAMPASIQRIAQPASAIKPEPKPVPINTTPLATLPPSTETSTSAAVSGKAPALFAAKGAASQPQEPKPTLLYLVVASIALAGIYLGLQYLNRRKKQVEKRPEIEVLGARRLGHRQELMIVRALGSDHLLLCTGGKAERVASTPTPVALPASPGKPAEDTQAGGIGLISRLSSHHRLRKLLDSVDQDLPSEPEEEADPEPSPRLKLNAFGEELFSARSKQPRLHSVPAGRRHSEAVAGLDRLRKRVAT